MKKINVRYTKQIIASIVAFGILTHFLFTSKDLTSKIIVIPFLIFSFAFFLKNIFLILNKRNLAAKISKVYVIAFLVYWFGFLIYWDYVSIVNKDYMSLLFSLLFWFGGGYIIYKRLKRENK